MFTTAERERVRERLVEIAASDRRVISAALVGSLAAGEPDRWSDIDLTFGVDDAVPMDDVLDDWTRRMAEEFDAVWLFDLSVRGTTYRVFLLDDWLQVDLSFTPASEFRQGSPRFKLLWGTHTTSDPPLPSARGLFGWGVIYGRAARASIDRKRWWQAEFCISALRDNTLTLACVRRGIRTGHGNGFDELPTSVAASFDDALVRSLDRDELLRALSSAFGGLLREAGDVQDLARSVEHQLLQLTTMR
jgi:predicted nucleotidyltransferase